MSDLTAGSTFTAGQTISHTDLNGIISGASISSDVIDNANINTSAAIDFSKMDSGTACDAASYAVSGTTVITAGLGLQNITSLNMAGPSTFTGVVASTQMVVVDFTSNGVAINPTSANIYHTTTNLGENSGDTVNINATLAGNPTLTSATPDFAADSLIGLDAGALKSFALTGFQEALSFAVVEDQKAAGTDGGSATTGAWTAREINTEAHDPDSLVSISSNQVTLAAGTYLVDVEASFYSVNRCRLRFYNDTQSSTELLSTTNIANSSGAVPRIRGVITANGTDVFEVQYHCQNNNGSNSLGSGYDTGEVETYLRATFAKIA